MSAVAVQILSPVGGVIVPPVSIQYALSNPDSHPVNIAVAYSLDQGATFAAASRSTTAPGDSATGLITSPAGEAHVFAWDAAGDLKNAAAPNILISIVGTDPSDGMTGSALSAAFAINYPPQVAITTPHGGYVTPPVAINYILSDAESDPVSIDVTYSTDGGATFQPATQAVGKGGEGVQNLTSAPRPGGVPHLFIWDATTDLHGRSAAAVVVRIACFDANPGGVDTSASFSVDTPPSLRIVGLTSATWPGSVAVNYMTSDAESDPISIVPSFSIDGGLTFKAASQASSPAGDGLTNLASSPTGVAHVFSWDAPKDLQGVTAARVLFRIAPFDPQPGVVDTYAPVRIGAPLPAGTVVPSVNVMAPPDNIGPQVPVHFMVAAPDSQPVDVLIQYSAGGGFTTATAAATSDRLTNLPAPAVGADYRFVWDAQADSVPAGPVMLRVTASRGAIVGTPSTTQCAVDATPYAPPINYDDPLLFDIAGIDFAAGSPAQQTGLSGQLLPQSLCVTVYDSSGAAVPGARVAFLPTQGADLFTLERDLLFGRSIPRFGQGALAGGAAAVRVRAKPGATGDGAVEAQVVGVPSMSVTFTFTIAQPQIVLDDIYGPPPTPLLNPPTPGVISVYYNGDGANANSGYAEEAVNPLLLTATGVGISTPRQVQPGQTLGGCPQRGVAGTITLRHPTDSSVAPATIVIPALPALAGPYRMTGGNTQTPITSPIGLTFRPIEAAAIDLMGMSGRTLSTSLALQLKDQSGQSYDWRLLDLAMASVTGDDTPLTDAQFTVPPAIDRQQVLYEVQGTNAGTLSASQGPGTGPTLTVQLGTDIYFTPIGAGPWQIHATVVDPIYDGTDQGPTSIKVTWQWSNVFPGGSTTPQACRVWAVGSGSVGASDDSTGEQDYWFFISPPVASFSKSATADMPVGEVEPGDRIYLRVTASPTLAGSPVVVLEGLNADDSLGAVQPLAPVGMKLPWEQTLTLTAAPDGVLVSQEILVVSGEPEVSGPAQVVQAVVPGGWLRASSDCFSTAVSVAARAAERRVVGGVESALEAPTGTSPRGGAGGTTLLHSGEVLYEIADLTFATAHGHLALARRYRSHAAQVDGPLGPGWFLAMTPSLDVSQMNSTYFIRVFDGGGRVDDYYLGDPLCFQCDFAPRGFAWKLTFGQAIDDNNSAYILYDAHGAETHFHVDGTLRFIRDRWGLKTIYAHDEAGRLVRITDPHGRSINLSYNTDGRLSHVDGLSSEQIVDFDYYPVGDPAAGWLQSVTWSPADTLLASGTPGGQATAAYRRSESYAYSIDPTNQRDGLLRTVTNGEGAVLVTNTYDSEKRIQTQQAGAGTFTFDFTKPQITRVQDRELNWTTFGFSAAAYPLNCVAVSHTDAAQNLWSLAHNADGRLIKLTSPLGDVTTYLYDYTAPTDGLQWPFNRPNLLQITRTSASGQSRVSRYEFAPFGGFRTSSFNSLIRSIEPRGNQPAASPGLFARNYLYDFQVTGGLDPDLVAGVSGNLVRVSSAPSARPVIAADGSADWKCNRSEEVFKYNGYGQVIWHRDAHGVISEFAYYGLKSPTSGPADSAGGGFVLSRSRDTTPHPVRDDNLPNVALTPSTIGWTYDGHGNLSGMTDAAGATTAISTNALHEVTSVSSPAGATMNGQPTAQPDLIEDQFAFNPRGQMAQHKLSQLGASAAAGGDSPFHEVWTDPAGVPTDSHATISEDPQDPVAVGHGVFGADRNGVLTGLYPPDVQTAYGGAGPVASVATGASATADAGGVRLSLDQRGLPASVLTGVDPPSGGTTTSALLTSLCGWTTDGQLQSTTAAGAKNPHTFFYDDFGVGYGSVDPHGNIHHVLPDDLGAPTRSMTRQGEGGPNETARAILPAIPDAPIQSAHETIRDAVGRVRRVHRAAFTPDMAGAGQAGNAFSTAAEYLPVAVGAGAVSWPPPTGSPLPDAGWGPGDSRVTSDVAYDGLHLPVRSVTDSQGVVHIRRDSHGRPLDIFLYGGDTPTANNVLRKTSYQFDALGNPAEVDIVDSPTDPTQTALLLPVKYEHDALGRQTRHIDGDGNAERVEYDQLGHIYVAYDAMGADSAEFFNGNPVNLDGNKTTYARNARGLVTSFQTVLTTDGTGAAPQDTTNPYNLSGVVGTHTQYSAEGRIVRFFDQAGYKTEFGYDSYGRLQGVSFDSAPSLGGVTTCTRQYDPATGRLWRSTDANGSVLEYAYDDLGRTTRQSVITAGPGVIGNAGYSWTYRGAHVLMTDLSTGRVVEQVVDSLGRTIADIQDGVAVSRGFNGTGKTVLLQYPFSDGDVAYIRDTADRLRSVTDRGQPMAAYDYIGPHRVSGHTQGSVSTRYSYSPGSGRLISKTITGVTAPALLQGPWATIVTPGGGAPTAPVNIRYLLFSPQAASLGIALSYSVDGGVSFSTASEGAGGASEGVVNLTATPDGTTHLFIWDATKDLGGAAPAAIIVRIQVLGASVGTSSRSAAFVIGGAATNQAPGLALRPIALTVPTTAVRVTYVLVDPESDLCAVSATYSINGGATFAPATEATGVTSDGTSNLTSSPTGTLHAFAWDAATDLGGRPVDGVLLRLQASDSQPGGSDTAALFGAAGANTIEYRLQRDRAGRLVRSTRLVGGVGDLKAWRYDSAGRIVFAARQASWTGARQPLERRRLFDGDAVLREEVLETATPTGVAMSTHSTVREERGRIASRDGIAFTYDRNGALTADDAFQYAYDALGRLAQVKNTAGVVATYAYDAAGRCISKVSAAGTEEYIYDGYELIEVRTAGALVERYVYGDQLDDLLKVEIGKQPFWVLHSPEGYIEGLVDAQGNVIELYDYGLSGELTVLDPSGTPRPAGTRPICRLLFQRCVYDPDSLLYRYRMRWYSWRIGIFLSPDPAGIASGPNFYVLNKGNPVYWVDRFGMDDGPYWGSGAERALRGTAKDKRNWFQKVYDAPEGTLDPNGWMHKLFYEGPPLLTWESSKYAFSEGVASPTADAAAIVVAGGAQQALGKAILRRTGAEALTVTGRLVTAAASGTTGGVTDRAVNDLLTLKASSPEQYLKDAATWAVIAVGTEAMVIVGGGVIKRIVMRARVRRLVKEGMEILKEGDRKTFYRTKLTQKELEEFAQRGLKVAEDADVIVLGSDTIPGPKGRLPNPAFQDQLDAFAERYPGRSKVIGDAMQHPLDWDPIKNKALIEGAILERVPIAFATAPEEAAAGSFFRREIDWLEKAGFKLFPPTDASRALFPFGGMAPPAPASSPLGETAAQVAKWLAALAGASAAKKQLADKPEEEK